MPEADEVVKGRIAAEHLRGSVELYVQHFPRFLCLGEAGEVYVRAAVAEPRGDRHAVRADEDLGDGVVEEQVPRPRLVHRRVRETLVEGPDGHLVLEERSLDVLGPS